MLCGLWTLGLYQYLFLSQRMSSSVSDLIHFNSIIPPKSMAFICRIHQLMIEYWSENVHELLKRVERGNNLLVIGIHIPSVVASVGTNSRVDTNTCASQKCDISITQELC